MAGPEAGSTRTKPRRHDGNAIFCAFDELNAGAATCPDWDNGKNRLSVKGCHIVEAAADGLCAPGTTFLVGHFESLCNRPAAGQFDITVDAHIDDHRAVFDCKSFVDLAEIVGAVDSKALGAKADRQFFEIRLSDFRIFCREALVDEVVPLLPDGVVVENEYGERQVVTDRGVEVGDVHHERRICCDVSDPPTWSRKTRAECDAQALPNCAEIRPE